MVWLEFEGNPVQWEEQFAVGYCWLAGNQGKKSSAVQQIWSKLSACAMHPWIQWPILTMLRLLLNPLSSCIYFSPRISLHLLMQTYIYPKWWKMHQLFMIRWDLWGGRGGGGKKCVRAKNVGVKIWWDKEFRESTFLGASLANGVRALWGSEDHPWHTWYFECFCFLVFKACYFRLSCEHHLKILT